MPFSLATSFAWQDPKTKAKREAVDFHDCVVQGRLGDIIRRYVREGAKLYVEGRLLTRPYVGRDGAKKIATEIVADNVIMLGHRTTPRNGSVNGRYARTSTSTPRTRGG